MHRGKHLILLGIVALLVVAPSIALATEPLFDRIEVEGQSGRLRDNAQGWLKLPESEHLRAIAKAERCTAIGGPRGKFRIANGTLWLDGLYRCGGDIELSSVYPDASQPLAATWITGELTAELGNSACRSRAGPLVFGKVAAISVKSGKVTALSYSSPSTEECSRNKPQPHPPGGS